MSQWVFDDEALDDKEPVRGPFSDKPPSDIFINSVGLDSGIFGRGAISVDGLSSMMMFLPETGNLMNWNRCVRTPSQTQIGIGVSLRLVECHSVARPPL